MSISPQLIWFLIGVLFLVGELSAPGFILIFFTAGCWITAIVTAFSGIDTTIQIVLFIFSSLVLLVLLRKYGLKTFKGETREPAAEKSRDAKIGKTAIVTQPITPDTPGEIKALGSFWRAVADTSIEAGQSVVIENPASEDGLTYKVSALPGGSHE